MAGIGLGKELAPYWRQGISWTNDDLLYWRICMSPGIGKLTNEMQFSCFKNYSNWYSLLKHDMRNFN